MSQSIKMDQPSKFAKYGARNLENENSVDCKGFRSLLNIDLSEVKLIGVIETGLEVLLIIEAEST